MTVADAGVTHIIIEWDEVDCEERNGVITGYSVRYGLSSGMPRKTVNISGTDVENRIFRMDGLLIRTNYSFEVAAINRNGVGAYTSAITITTTVPNGLVVLMVSYLSLSIYCRSWFLSEWSAVSQQQHC